MIRAKNQRESAATNQEAAGSSPAGRAIPTFRWSVHALQSSAASPLAFGSPRMGTSPAGRATPAVRRDLAVSRLRRGRSVRERDPYPFPSVSANELDSLYHEFTDFDRNGETAKRFVDALQQAGEVLHIAYAVRHVKPQGRIKLKVRRLDVTALIMFLQDVSKNPLFKLDSAALATRSRKAESEDRPGRKSTSGSTLQAYYEWWRTNVAGDVGIRLDPRRAFNDEQKDEIRRRDRGLCQVCEKEVSPTDAEFDHFPIPYRDGGRGNRKWAARA